MSRAAESAPAQRLARVVGVPGAVLMGLGSILGTGIFVSVGIAAGIAGPAVVLAVALAALVATFNGLSSAQLAASHPVSGGTYEYGYRYLSPALGFTAGWMFLCAKSASAATAALGFAGYLLSAFGASDERARVALALLAAGLLTALVASGMRRSNRANAAIVSVTLLALVAFVFAGLPAARAGAPAHLAGFFAAEEGGARGLLHATALMFVAYTGYGRIATLGEEIRAPERSIPRAIVVTLLATMALYVAVALVAVSAAGAPRMAEATRAAAAPLAVLARELEAPGVAWLVTGGAVAAMLGVLLNLLLGLSRVLLAMARRGDAPPALARLAGEEASPRRAVVAVGVLVAALAATGSVRTTWSFSAFTVLVYYAITNLAALRLPAASRRYPRWVAAAGLACCLGLAFWVEPRIWLAGLGLVALGLAWHALARRAAPATRRADARPPPATVCAVKPLAGRVALVAGATRGAGRGIAAELGAAGAVVYATGRTTRTARSEMDRPETIEETAALVDAAGGRGIAVRVDHLVPDEVRALVARIEAEHGRLDVLVNDIWGATVMEWNKTVWESDLALGLATLRRGVETHAITCHFALPLLLRAPGGLVVEVNDGTDAYNAKNYRVSFFYDLAKAAVGRIAFALAHELGPRGATALSLTPGWLRSEAMLEAYGVTESNWRDATRVSPHFAISESPAYVGRAVVALASDPDVARWNGSSLSSGQLAKVYGFTDLDGSQPDAWRYLVEVQDAGKPADVTGYR